MPVVALLVGAAILGAPAQAWAAFTLTLTDFNNNTSSVVATTTITDNGPGDSDPLTGRISFNGALGTEFLVQGDFATSNSANNVQPARLTINNTTITSLDNVGLAVSQMRTITVTVSDDGFTAPGIGPAGMESRLSSTDLPNTAQVTFQSFVNGTGGTLLTLNNVSAAGVRASDQVNIGTSPYTLSSVTTYTVQGQGLTTALTLQSTGITAVAVPAPAGLVLALTGLPFAGLGCWLRRRRKA